MNTINPNQWEKKFQIKLGFIDLITNNNYMSFQAALGYLPIKLQTLNKLLEAHKKSDILNSSHLQIT